MPGTLTGFFFSFFVEFCYFSVAINSGRFRGEGGDGVTAPLWSDREFLDNFFTVFVSFVILQLDCKIRVPRLSCCLPVKKLWQSAPKLIFLGITTDFFLGGGVAQSLHHTLLH